jgi:ribonuclease P protein subunit RPR2
MARGREKGEQKEIAAERIGILFSQAEALCRDGDLAAASSRVRQARDISLRCNARIPRELKARFCRRCLTYFSSETMMCRLDPVERRIRMSCLRCGHVAFMPYARKAP